MEKLLEILWGSLGVCAVVAFFVVMYFSAGISYDFSIRTKRDNPELWKIIGFNDKYLNDREKWIRHTRIYIVLFTLLFLAILFPFIMML